MNQAQKRTLEAFNRYRKLGRASRSEQAKARRILDRIEVKAKAEMAEKQRDADRRFKEALHDGVERHAWELRRA